MGGADPQGWVTDPAVPTALAHGAHPDPKGGDGCYLPLPSLVPRGPTATGVAAASESGEQHQKMEGMEGSKHLSGPLSQSSPIILQRNTAPPCPTSTPQAGEVQASFCVRL